MKVKARQWTTQNCTPKNNYCRDPRISGSIQGSIEFEIQYWNSGEHLILSKEEGTYIWEGYWRSPTCSKYIWNNNLTGDKGVKKSGKIKEMNCGRITCSQFRLFLNSKIVFYNWHTKFQLFFCSNSSAISQPNHYTKMRTFHSILFSINTVQPAVFILLCSSAKKCHRIINIC